MFAFAWGTELYSGLVNSEQHASKTVYYSLYISSENRSPSEFNVKC